LPGLQDITAHVDFSALARAAADAGSRAGYATSAVPRQLRITELLAKRIRRREALPAGRVRGAEAALASEMGNCSRCWRSVRG